MSNPLWHLKRSVFLLCGPSSLFSLSLSLSLFLSISSPCELTGPKLSSLIWIHFCDSTCLYFRSLLPPPTHLYSFILPAIHWVLVVALFPLVHHLLFLLSSCLHQKAPKPKAQSSCHLLRRPSFEKGRKKKMPFLWSRPVAQFCFYFSFCLALTEWHIAHLSSFHVIEILSSLAAKASFNFPSPSLFLSASPHLTDASLSLSFSFSFFFSFSFSLSPFFFLSISLSFSSMHFCHFSKCSFGAQSTGHEFLDCKINCMIHTQSKSAIWYWVQV